MARSRGNAVQHLNLDLRWKGRSSLWYWAGQGELRASSPLFVGRADWHSFDAHAAIRDGDNRVKPEACERCALTLRQGEVTKERIESAPATFARRNYLMITCIVRLRQPVPLFACTESIVTEIGHANYAWMDE